MSESATQVLRRLAFPIYLPTAVYSAGAAAIVPVVPVLALRMGFDTAQVALIIALTSIFVAFGPLPAGFVTARIGERAGLIGGALVSVLGSLGCAAAAAGLVADGGTMLVACLFVMAAGDLLWDLGRQTYLAGEVPAAVRARAMSMFGGTQRMGRVVGPLLGSLVLVLAGMAEVFLLHAAFSVVALVLVARFVAPSARSVEDPSRRARDRVRLAPLVLVALGVAALLLGRATRDVLIPLVGHASGYSESTISLAFAIGAVAELALFLPGGIIMDRWGRLAVLAPSMIGLGIPLALLPSASSLPLFIVAVAVMGVSNGLGAGINKTLSVDYTPELGRARYLGYWNTIVGLGSFAGPGLIAAATATVSLAAACVSCGVVTALGAGWAAYWMRRFPAMGRN